MSSTVKILTVGSAVGSIRDLFAKIKAIDAKHGKFDLVLCTGDFFGPPKNQDEYTEADEVMQLLNGSLEAPVECYIMQGEYPLPPPVIEKFAKTSGQLAKSVFLLHKSGLMTTAHGLRIACLGGIYDSKLYHAAETLHGFTSPYFTSLTMEKLLSNTMTESTPASANSKISSYTSLASIKASTSTSPLVDILLTNTFPADVTALSSVQLPSPSFPTTEGAEPVADLVRRTKPRYHFVAGGGSKQTPMFWEREPFTWDDENGRVSRFIGLGAFGGESTPSTGKKQRWFYAFSIAPLSPNSPQTARPANSTGNPFTERTVPRGMKRPFESGNAEGENFRWGNVKQSGKRSRVGGQEGKPPAGYKCKICESPDHFINDCPDRAKPKEGYICKICKEPGHFVRDCPTKHQVGDTGGRKPPEGYVCRACGSEAHFIQDCPVASQPQSSRGHRGPPKEIAPDECWFCLSNPNLAKHLIVSIGSECYVTLPKGQIIPTHSSSNHPRGKVPAVPGGGHVLIVPISHYTTYASIPPDLAEPIIEETEKYKSALRAFYAAYDAHPIAFEVGRLSAKGGHAHVQVVPVPKSITADQIAEWFISEGKRLGIDLEFDESTGPPSAGDRGYFRVDLPDGRRLVHHLKDGVPFSVQFGRQVIVSLLAMPERFDWKECAQSEEDDKADAQNFKEAFIQYDPTL
ncbi:CwfJ C-terminus 1-domain-containing protein-like protein [Abortiporus biennis]|nr:CwfJ C-terminus 1-domain-containing protein-like protein [Abortiporus biennis]